ncbi:hypothetical protein FRC11_002533, partial [Ceratobasidium sp. 423]
MKSALILAFIGSALGRTFTIYNKCSYTVWPAIFTDLNVGTSVPAVETGWEALAGSSRTFTVPNDWKAGRIWGRTGCDFSSKTGADACLTGGCNGGLECDSKTGTGVAPVSIAEWTLGTSSNSDYYDVSLVDGFNLPIQITNNVGCPVVDCPIDLNPNCPDALKGPLNANGTAAGCKYYSYFKNGCPRSFVYPYDDSNGGPVLQDCAASKKAD